MRSMPTSRPRAVPEAFKQILTEEIRETEDDLHQPIMSVLCEKSRAHDQAETTRQEKILKVDSRELPHEYSPRREINVSIARAGKAREGEKLKGNRTGKNLEA
ncbi:hypothetical protein EV714DRAFT_277779 [Schizophyllum commune]